MSQIRLPGLDEQCRCHPEPECSPQEGLGHGGWPVTYLTGSEPKKVVGGRQGRELDKERQAVSRSVDPMPPHDGLITQCPSHSPQDVGLLAQPGCLEGCGEEDPGA